MGIWCCCLVVWPAELSHQLGTAGNKKWSIRLSASASCTAPMIGSGVRVVLPLAASLLRRPNYSTYSRCLHKEASTDLFNRSDATLHCKGGSVQLLSIRLSNFIDTTSSFNMRLLLCCTVLQLEQTRWVCRMHPLHVAVKLSQCCPSRISGVSS